jgi:hypothetical protein
LFEIKALFGDEGYLLGWPENNQYILDGKFVDIPEMPGAGYKWSYEHLMWVFNTEVAESQMMFKRHDLLAATDWTQLPDVPLATKKIWADYRQLLRDITIQEGFPENIIWPIKPE